MSSLRRSRASAAAAEAEALTASLFGSGQALGAEPRWEIPAPDEASDDSSASSSSSSPSLSACWSDSDDAHVTLAHAHTQRRLKLRATQDETHVDAREYQRRLRVQHQQLARNSAAWASFTRESDSDSDSDSNEETPRTASRAIENTSPLLPPERLLIGRMDDVTTDEEARGAVQSISFHPRGEVVALASLDRTLRLFSVSARDDSAPAKLCSVRTHDLPLTHCAFAASGTDVFALGAARHFYAYALEHSALERCTTLSGKSFDDAKLTHVATRDDALAVSDARGRVHMLSARTREWVCSLACGAPVSAVQVREGGDVVCATRAGEVVEWDMRMRRARLRWRDHGATHTTALAVSGDWLATGSDCGVVNVYRGEADSAAPVPVRALENLRTEVSALAFNFDAQMLAMASSQKKNALRFVHLPTATVFQNFPKETTPLSRVTALSFSPSGDSIVLGNVRGKAMRYRLHHYRAHGK